MLQELCHYPGPRWIAGGNGLSARGARVCVDSGASGRRVSCCGHLSQVAHLSRLSCFGVLQLGAVGVEW